MFSTEISRKFSYIIKQDPDNILVINVARNIGVLFHTFYY